MSYAEAYDAGYMGDSPEVERRHRLRVMRNNAMDCRDPDHDESLCPHCNPGEQDDE